MCLYEEIYQCQIFAGVQTSMVKRVYVLLYDFYIRVAEINLLLEVIAFAARITIVFFFIRVVRVPWQPYAGIYIIYSHYDPP